MSRMLAWRKESDCKTFVILLEAMLRGTLSIHHAADAFERLAGERVARLDGQRFLTEFANAVDQAFGEIDASEIEVWEVARFITPGGHGLFEPWDCFVIAIEVDQRNADIVIRIAEVWIDL